VDEKEISARKKNFKPQEKDEPSGVLRRYRKMVTSASTGAVFED
jgi:dihydroxyacid dehydratase/phosphogluconate dehydratase